MGLREIELNRFRKTFLGNYVTEFSPVIRVNVMKSHNHCSFNDVILEESIILSEVKERDTKFV